eukprot:6965121-Pyramimonas_sp.AAC.1
MARQAPTALGGAARHETIAKSEKTKSGERRSSWSSWSSAFGPLASDVFRWAMSSLSSDVALFH